MQKSYPGLYILVFLIYCLASSFASYQVIKKSLQYQHNMQIYTHVLNYQERLLNIESWLGGGEDQERLFRAERKKEEALAAMKTAKKYAWGLAIGSLGFLCLIFMLTRPHEQRPKWRMTALFTVALLCLILGLFTPMLEIGAFERDLSIPLRLKTKLFSLNLDRTQVFEGDMYFYYQSKSIVELISLLFKQGNIIVGGSIFVFSILIPISKLLFSFLHTWEISFTKNPLLQKAMKKIAKWSMADVFVAAIFLAFLAFSNLEAGIQTQSHTLIGLYFFLGYVLISVGVGGRVEN